MLDHKPYFTLRMWKMSSYNWYGIWMRPGGEAVQEGGGLLDTGHLKVGQIKFAQGEREGLVDRIAQALHKGGWAPGDTIQAARIALLKHCPGYINRV